MFGGGETCIQRFGGETEEKRPLGRHRHRWEEYIKLDFQEGDWGGGHRLY